MQFKKADVEPGAEACFQLTVERTQRRVLVEVAQQVGAQIDEKLDALRDGIELGQDAQARRAHRAAQCRFGRPLPIAADRGLILGMCLFDGLRVRAELGGDDAQEGCPSFIAEVQISFGQPGGALPHRHLAAEADGAFLELIADLAQLALADLARRGMLGEHPAYFLQPSSNDSFRHLPSP